MKQFFGFVSSYDDMPAILIAQLVVETGRWPDDVGGRLSTSGDVLPERFCYRFCLLLYPVGACTCEDETGQLFVWGILTGSAGLQLVAIESQVVVGSRCLNDRQLGVVGLNDALTS